MRGNAGPSSTCGRDYRPPFLGGGAVTESPPIPSNRRLYRPFQARVPEEAPEIARDPVAPQNARTPAVAGVLS